MKRFTFLFLLLLLARLGHSQAVIAVEAPLNSNSSSINRGPNGTAAHAFVRGSYLVKQSELININPGTVITSFGFTLATGATGMAVAGNFTVYLENTADATYQKGTNYAAAVSTMTNAFAGVMTVPAVGATSVMVTLSTPITYTGGGLYVAYDWASAGPFAGTGAAYWGETGVLPLPGGGGGIAYDAVSAPATTTLTSARPSFLFSYNNPNSNDIQVLIVEAPGKVSATFNTPQTVRAYVRNIGNATQNNITVNFNVTGANAFSTSQVISSLAPGSGSLVSFNTFNPSNLGLNTLSLSVPGDQNNLNNALVYSQSVTCNEWSPVPLNPTGYSVTTLGFAAPASGIIGIPYTPPVNTTLVGLRGAVGSSPLALNGQACGVLLTAAGAVVATTNTITVTAPMQGLFQTFTFSSPQSLSAGTSYYIGFVQITPGASIAGLMPAYYQSSFPYWYVGNTAGGVMTQLTVNYGHMGLEAIFGEGTISVTSTPSTVCLGSCATLSASGVPSYTWSTGIFNFPATVCPTVATTYSVAGTNTLGCPMSAIIPVGINQLPGVVATSTDNSICDGASFSFTASGAMSYSWSNGPTTATNITTPTASTTYTVFGTDANGCVNTATIDVSLITLSVTVTSNTAVCKGKSASLTASGAGPYTFNWAVGTGHPFSNISVTPTITTTYTVNANDINGCLQSNTVEVTVNANPTVTASSSRTIICRGESAVLTASGAATYFWSANSGTLAPSVSVAPQLTSNYIVTGTNSAGCTHSTSISVAVDACTGISATSSQNLMVRVFPNPGSGLFHISAEALPQSGHLEVYNALGALVKKQSVAGSEAQQMDLSSEPNGLYFLQILDQGKLLHIARLVKQ